MAVAPVTTVLIPGGVWEPWRSVTSHHSWSSPLSVDGAFGGIEGGYGDNVASGAWCVRLGWPGGGGPWFPGEGEVR